MYRERPTKEDLQERKPVAPSDDRGGQKLVELINMFLECSASLHETKTQTNQKHQIQMN